MTHEEVDKHEIKGACGKGPFHAAAAAGAAAA